MKKEIRYWLMKSEPTTYSIDHLKKEKKTSWEGVRNYQARNFMQEMRTSDLVLFYHSNTTEPGVMGIGKICKEAYPDHTQWDKKSDYYDPKATKENPRWFMPDVCFVKKFSTPVTLTTLKSSPFFKDMLVTQRGSRLSVQPVSKKHFDKIVSLGDR